MKTDPTKPKVWEVIRATSGVTFIQCGVKSFSLHFDDGEAPLIAAQLNKLEQQAHLAKANKLFLAAEDMLAALQMIKNGMEWTRDSRPPIWENSDDKALAQVEAAIAKATGTPTLQFFDELGTFTPPAM